MASSCVARSGNGAALGLRVQAAKRSRSSEWVNRPMPSIHCTRAIARTFCPPIAQIDHARGHGSRLVQAQRGNYASAEISKMCRFCESFFGAGEGIRTLDPNLGKVVLYP